MAAQYTLCSMCLCPAGTLAVHGKRARRFFFGDGDKFVYLSQDLGIASELDQSVFGPRLGRHVYCGITSEEEKQLAILVR